jgi:outer membrane protein assembly factor BamB
MKLNLLLREYLLVILSSLIILFQLGINIYAANALILDVNIDLNKQLFDVGETIIITGNVTLDGVLKNDSLVAIQLDFPNGNNFLFRTVETGNVSGGYWKVRILDLYTADSLLNKKTLFNRGDWVYVNLTIENVDVTAHYVLATFYIQCSDSTPLPVFTTTLDIDGKQIIRIYKSFMIPTDDPIGEARIYASLFSDLPANIGTPYCPEEEATFYVNSTTPSMPPQPDLFNVTFALPVKDLLRGNYTVYATTKYITATSIEIKQFTVRGPTPVFTWSPANPIVGQIVTFDGSASYDIGGTITDWFWQFSDGATASGPIITHIYEIGGYSYVILRVTDNDGGENSTTRVITITEAWPMFHHNPSHWGNSTSLSPVTNRTLWVREIGPNVNADPWMYPSAAIYPNLSANVIFAGASNGTIYALSATDGALLWKRTPSPGFKLYSSPAVAYGYVFIGSEDGRVYALNVTTGEIMYNITTDDSVYSSPAIAGDKVFIGSRDKKVHAFYVNGTSLWMSTELDGGIYSSPAISAGKVFVATSNGSLYALCDTNGTIKWRTNLATNTIIYSSPAIAYNRIFIGSTDNKIYALDTESGSILWSFTTNGQIYSSPAVVSGTVFVGSMNNGLYALNAITGALVWHNPIGQVRWSSPAIAEGKVFIGTTDGRVYALRQTDGNIWWSYQTDAAIDSSPSVLNDTLYTCSKDGKLYVFSSQTHNVALTSILPSKTLVKKGETPTIQITLWNKGSFNELVNVTAYYNSTIFCSTSINLARGGQYLIPIYWNTTFVDPGYYEIFVNVSLIPPAVDEEPSDNVGVCPIKVEYADLGMIELVPSTPKVNTSSTIPIKNLIGEGYGVTIYAFIKNKSNFTESNVQVTFYWSNSTHFNQTIGSVIMPELQASTSIVVNITWTANVAYGKYTISAYVWPVFGEVETADNLYNYGVTEVVISGDVTSKTANIPDGKVDMRDIGAICNLFGTTPSSTNWDPNKDINNDGVINMRDIGIACENYGKSAIY